ncbi:MAG: sortase [Oscillospiraceae bacterium]|nr:sortase [Oscillospiraceae bacterium]
MSDENKAIGGAPDNGNAPESEAVPVSGDVSEKGSGYFESLIEDFDLNAPVREDVPKPGLKDFSRFFNDAAAFGGGFESTIDKDVSKQLTAEFPMGEGATLDFFGGTAAGDIITTPVTDEDGMIVIFDEEAGIDATSAVVPESVERFLADSSLSEEEAPEKENTEEMSDEVTENSDAPDSERNEETVEMPEDNYSADSNIGEDVPENESGKNAEGSSEKKRPFIAGLFPWAGDSVGEVIRKIIFLVSACVFIGAGIMLVGTLRDSQEAIEMQNDFQSMMSSISTTVATSVNEKGETVTIPPTPEEEISFMSSILLELPENVKGILQMPSLDLDYPVVQGSDNDYYLTHTYDDRKNRAGAIFMDYRCTHTAEYTSPNLVLYGHNQSDGTMFGKLKYYKNNVDFYKHSPMIYFKTDFEAGEYVIFGYFISNVHEYQDSSGEVFHYHDYIETLNNESTFNWYMSEVQERNQIISPVDVVFGDRLLVLSTCSSEYNDSRFVVMARKLRANESYSSFNFKAATLNPYAKQIDWDAILASNSVPVIRNSPALVSAVDGVPGNADIILSSVYQQYENSYGAMEEISDSNTDIQIINEETVIDDIPVVSETEAAATANATVAVTSETQETAPTAASETTAEIADSAVTDSLFSDTTASGESEAASADDTSVGLSDNTDAASEASQAQS